MMYHPGIDTIWSGLTLLQMDYLEQVHGFAPVEELPYREGGYREQVVSERLRLRLNKAAFAWQKARPSEY